MPRSKRRVVFVRWFDASFQNEECTEDQLNPDVILETAGIFVREDERFLTLALDFHDSDDRSDKTWRHISHIPKVNILKTKFFSV